MHVSVKQNNLIENTKENLSLKTTEKEGEKLNFLQLWYQLIQVNNEFIFV